MANHAARKPNSGSFQKGHDPRRMTPEKFKNGQLVRDLAKAQTEQAIATLSEIMRDTEESGANRIKASEALLNRAWGTPVNAVAIATTTDTPAHKLTRGELDAAIAKALGIGGETIEGQLAPSDED